MWKNIIVEHEFEQLKEPVLLVSLSTSAPQFLAMYSQARELASYLLEQGSGGDFKKFASFYSSALPAAVSVSEEGVSDLVGVHFYLNRRRRNDDAAAQDLILAAGYCSPSGEEYDFSSELLAFASKKLGVTEVISIGPRWNEEPLSPIDTPRVLGFSTDTDGNKWLEDNGVLVIKNEPAYYFSNTIIAMCPRYGLRGFKLSVNHGEPRPHPKSVASLLHILNKKFGLSVDLRPLEKKAKELAELISLQATGKNHQSSEEFEVRTGKKEQDIYR